MIEASTKPSVRNWRDWVGLVARLTVGVVLLVAGLIKVVDILGMQLALNAYQLFPAPVVLVLSYVIPIAEIVLGIMLILGLFTRITSILSGLLFVAFIIGIAQAWARGLSLDCGCFGGGGQIDPSQTEYPEEIARDLGLLAACAWLAIRPRSLASIDQWLFAIHIPTDTFDDDPELETAS